MALVGSYVGLSKVLVVVFPIFLLALAALRHRRGGHGGLGASARPNETPKLSRHDRWLLFFESFFGNFLFSICMLFGVSMSSALAAGVIMAGIPAAVAVMSRVFLKERITGRVMLGIFVRGRRGIALVSFTKNSQRHARRQFAARQPVAGRRGVVRSELCGDGQEAYRQREPETHQRADQSLWGLLLVTPLGHLAGARASTSTGRRGRVHGGCCCFIRLLPAWSPCGCG